jgi:hypothetical protein
VSRSTRVVQGSMGTGVVKVYRGSGVLIGNSSSRTGSSTGVQEVYWGVGVQ